MSDAKENGHFGPPDLDKLHKSKGGTEGGACLTGHDGKFERKGNKNSCNYRYQGHEQALANGRIKSTLHSYKNYDFGRKKTLRTSAYPTKAGGMSPARYSAQVAIPRPGDWDITGPTAGPITRVSFETKPVVVPVGMNFSQDTWPYWNNAHHIIPKGTLKDVIAVQPGNISEMIQKGLMLAKYNVNHKINMFLLPQDKTVAKVLGLTRHIQLAEPDRNGVEKSYCDHPEYNDLVKQKLERIVKSYKKICDDKLASMKRKHPIPKVDLDKTKLENCSKTMLSKILAWGKVVPGLSLSRATQDIG